MKTFLFVTLFIFAGSAMAGMYKWVDAEGNVHYSQKRPQNHDYKRIKKQAAPESAGKPLYSGGENQAKGADKAATQNSIADKDTAQNLEQRKKNCEGARQNLKNYQIYRRIKDKDGNVVTIDDDERAKNIQQAREAISSFCN